MSRTLTPGEATDQIMRLSAQQVEITSLLHQLAAGAKAMSEVLVEFERRVAALEQS